MRVGVPEWLLRVDRREIEWRIVSLCYFALGAMWAQLLIQSYGTPVFPEYVIAGTVIAGFGMTLSRCLRLIWETSRRRRKRPKY